MLRLRREGNDPVAGQRWQVTHHHYKDCPAYRGLTAGLHADAEAAVKAAAERTGTSFHYEPAGPLDGVVVTGPGGS